MLWYFYHHMCTNRDIILHAVYYQMCTSGDAYHIIWRYCHKLSHNVDLQICQYLYIRKANLNVHNLNWPLKIKSFSYRFISSGDQVTYQSPRQWNVFNYYQPNQFIFSLSKIDHDEFDIKQNDKYQLWNI